MTENLGQAGTLATLSSFATTQLGLAAINGGAGNALGVPKPFANPICLLEGVHIAGTTHVAQISQLADMLAPGMKLKLVRDVDNIHDKWAVKVLAPQNPYDQDRLGYLPCDHNEVIARLMDGGKRCFAKVVSMEVKGNWNKITIEVYLDD